MKEIMLLLLLVFTLKLKAQELNEFREADNLALTIPGSKTNSTDSIAGYIKSHLNSDAKKIRAIYSWVTANIRYSSDSSNAINLGENQEAKITVALRRRMGVCENYAAIFNDICVKSGLRSFVVNGYTRQNGSVDKMGHSWCAALIDNAWYLFDPTWDEGRTSSRYFMAQPSEFIVSHMPYDPMWQLLNYPISHRQFYSSSFSRRNDASYFNYVDSINAYFQMDSLHKLQSSASRILNGGLYNPLVKNNYNLTRMHIEMINQDKDVNLYNSSVADINDATAILNNFIQYRNNQFTPEKTDTELQAMLDGIDNKLHSSLNKLDEIDQSGATFTIGTQQVREKINALMVNTKEEKDFIQRYTSTAKSDRRSLFYK
jgi:hypothetical protein